MSKIQPVPYVPDTILSQLFGGAPVQSGSQDAPLDVFYGANGTSGNKTTNKDLPDWLKKLGMKGDAYAGGMLKPEIRYGFAYKNGKIHFADGTSYEAKKVKDKKTKQVTYQYTDSQGKAKTYDPTDEQDTYNKKYQNATANQSFVDKLGATADRSRQHVHDIFHGAGQALQGKGSIFGGTPLGTKLSNAVTGRHDKPIADQYGGPTKESQRKYVEEHGGGSLGYQPALHAVGSAIGTAAAAGYGASQLGALAGTSGAAQGGAAGGDLGIFSNGGTAGMAGVGGGNAGALAAAGGIAGGAGVGGTAAGALGGLSNVANGVSGAGSGGGMGSTAGLNWSDLIGTALNLYGAYNSAEGAKDARNDLSSAIKQQTTTLGAGALTGPGGLTAGVLANGAGGSYNLGDLEQARGFLTSLGTSSADAARTGGLPQNITDALSGVSNASGVPGLPDLSNLQDSLNSVLGRSMSDMNRGSVAPGLQGLAFNGAAQQLGDASRGFTDVRDSTLSNLRAQAQPFEERAYDKLNNDLFSSGRLGTTGGSLQTEAFARGLGQADLQRQLSANQEARTTQQNALGLGQGLAGVGSNIAGLDDSLLQSAFGRFAQTSNLASDLSQQRFGNSVLLNNTGYDRANTNLQNQITAAQLPTSLQGQQLQLALQALGGQGSLNDQGLSNFQAALAASQAGANARIGSGSNVAALIGQRAQMPTSNDIWGQVLTGIAGRIGNQNGNGSLGNILSGLFGGGK